MYNNFVSNLAFTAILICTQSVFAMVEVDDAIAPNFLPPKKRHTLEFRNEAAKKARFKNSNEDEDKGKGKEDSNSIEVIDLTLDESSDEEAPIAPTQEEQDLQKETLRHLATAYKLALDGKKVNLRGAIQQYREIYPHDVRTDADLMNYLRKSCRGL